LLRESFLEGIQIGYKKQPGIKVDKGRRKSECESCFAKG